MRSKGYFTPKKWGGLSQLLPLVSYVFRYEVNLWLHTKGFCLVILGIAELILQFHKEKEITTLPDKLAVIFNRNFQGNRLSVEPSYI